MKNVKKKVYPNPGACSFPKNREKKLQAIWNLWDVKGRHISFPIKYTVKSDIIFKLDRYNNAIKMLVVQRVRLR